MSALLEGIWDAAGDDVSEHWDRLPDAHRAVFVLELAMAEIYNGSLHQYYWNSTGNMAAYLPDAARFFGAASYAHIFERANALFAPGTLHDRGARQARLAELEQEGREEILEHLTDEIYDLEDTGDLVYPYVLDYVEARPGVFFLEG